VKAAVPGFFILITALVLSACVGSPASLPPEPTGTSPPPTATPTPTIVWFPPTATPTPFLAPVITPTLDVHPGAGQVIFQDNFSDGEGWLLSQSSAASIAIGKDELTLALHQPGGYLYSLQKEPLLGDFYLEITASPNLCKDADEYGLLLRVTPSIEFYRFSLSCDGRVRVDKYFHDTASSPQPWTFSGAVPPGAPSTSRLGVWAKGREMRFYINDQYQFSISDPSLPVGSLGVFVRSAGENDLTVSFSDLIVREALE